MEVAATPNSEQFPRLFVFELMIDLMGKTIDWRQLTGKN